MSLLHIYDSNSGIISMFAMELGGGNRVGVADVSKLTDSLDELSNSGTSFDRIIFTTHGSPGSIYFGESDVSDLYWRGKRGRFVEIASNTASIYFNGCDVAEGNQGWLFLEAVAGAFMSTKSGRVMGQTAPVLANPFGSLYNLPAAFAVPLGGEMRTVFVSENGGMTRRED